MSNQSVDKVIVIGMDGLDPKILERLMDGGQLPAFSCLKEMGAYCRLASVNPPQSPVVWSTIATGSNPGYHGIFDYITVNHAKYLPIHTTMRFNPGNLPGRRRSTFLPVQRGMPFWTLVSREKIPTTVIRYPVTFPPKEVYGHMLSGLGVPDLQGTLGRYTFYVEGTAPDDPDRKGDIISVNSDGGTIKTVLPGPNKFEIPLTMNVVHEQSLATITVGGSSFTLRQGEWSDWIQIKFNFPFKHVWGICRFFLQSARPLRLYLSSVQADPREPIFPISYPDEYAADLARDIGIYATLGIAEDTNALSDGCIDDEAFLSLCHSIMTEREKMLWHELGRFRNGLLVFVFDTTDRIQHIYWATGDAEHPAYNAEYARKYHNVIADYYRRMDTILGRVLEAVDDRTVLCIISDHGFGSFRRAVHLNSWLVKNGLMFLKKTGSNGQGDLLFKNVDWNRTRAYAVGFSSIYVNLEGRDGKGVVTPGNEAEQLKRKIADVLISLRDPETGTAVINRVYQRDELFNGPYIDEAPDLIVGYAPYYRASWQTAIGGAPDKILDDNLKKWSGDHITDARFVPGIFLINRPVSTISPTVKDIAPTILACFGIAKPNSMETNSL